MKRQVFRPMMKHDSMAVRVPGGFVMGGRAPVQPLPPVVGALYDFVTPPTPGEVLPGQIMLPEGNQGAMRISYVDSFANDHTELLKAMTFLDEISFGGATWFISNINISEYDTYSIFPVVLKTGSIPADAQYAVTVARP